MEKNIKRFLSLVLAFVMVFGMMPANVFATGTEPAEGASADEIIVNEEPMAEGDYVAQIGTQGYETLSAAIAAVQDGETIELLTEISEDVTIKQVSDVSFTIDGKGKTYTGTITVNGNNRASGAETLTIQNVNFVVDGYGIYAYGSETKTRQAHNVTVDNCTFTGTEGDNTDCGIYMGYCWNITVKNTTATGLGYFVNSYKALNGFTVENVTITDSATGFRVSYVNKPILFKNVKIENANVGVEIKNNTKGTVTFENCIIEADNNLVLSQQGTLTHVVNVAFQGDNTMICTGENWLVNNTPDYFPVTRDGDGDGVDNVTVVVPVAYAAKIDDQGYETLADAIAAVEDGETIVLLADNAEDVTIKQVANKSFTIDGNNKAHAYSGTISIDGSNRSTGAETLTIQNVKFEGGSIEAVRKTYVHNLTVDGCHFDGGENPYNAIILRHSYNITVKNTTATNLNELIYNNYAVTGLLVENVEVTNSHHGFWLRYGTNMVFRNVKLDTTSGGITIVNQNAATTLIEDCTISSGIPVVVVEETADKVYTLVFKGNNSFTATAGDAWLNVNGQGATVKVDLNEDNNLDISNVSFDQSYYTIENVENELWQIVKFDAVASIGNVGYETLAAAIAAVKNGETIVLLKDNAEDVTINQVSGVAFTIDGADFTYSGTMTVSGVSGNNGQGLTIQNVDFAVDGISIDTPKGSNARNITVDGCTFTGEGYNDYGIYLRNAYNITVKNTIGTKLFDLVYGNRAVTGFIAENVTVSDSSNGIMLAYVNSTAVFKDVTIDAIDDGVIIRNNAAGTVTFEGCSIDNVTYWPNNANNAVTMVFNDAQNNLVVGEDHTTLTAVLNKVDATLTAVEGLNVVSGVEGEDAVLYQNGVYFLGDPVAQVGEKKFATIQAAVDAANDGDVVVLLRDIELGNEDAVKTDTNYSVMAMVKDKSITLNMNGKTIKVAYTGTELLYSVVYVAEGAELTVTGNGTIDLYQEGMAGEHVNVVYLFWMHGTTGSLIIEDGTYHANNLEDSMVYSNGDKIVTVKGGTWTLDTVGSGDNGSPWIFNTKGQNERSIVVTGGTYNADVADQHWKGEVHIPEDYICEDNGDGTWTVHKGEYVARIGEKKYTTLEKAIAAVEDGETIVLLTACAENVTIEQQKDLSFTIDGDGKTYTGTITVDGSGRSTGTETLTIQNVNFVVDGIGGIDAYTKNNYAHNLTVDKCTFTGTNGDNLDYAIRLRHVYNITVKNTTGTNLFDLVYGVGAVTGFTAENVTVTESKNGIVLSYVNSTAVFKNVTTDVIDDGVIIRNNAAGVVTFEKCSIDNVTYWPTDANNKAVTMVFNDAQNNLIISGDHSKLTAVLNQVDATLTAVKGLNVVANEELAKSYMVVYENDTYYRLGKAIAQNTKTGKLYMDLSDGLKEAVSGQTVILLDETAEDLVLVPAGVTFDLNGHVVEAGNVLSFGVVMDTAKTVGGIKISNKTTEAFTKLQPENGGYLPIYDSTNGMYKFFEYTLVNGGYKKVSDNEIKFGIKILFENRAAYTLLADTENESCISLYLRITWTGLKEYDINHKISAGTIAKYATSVLNAAPGKSPAMTISIEGIKNLESGEFVKAAPWLTTRTEVAADTDYETYTKE